jgi:hypothetical protein
LLKDDLTKQEIENQIKELEANLKDLRATYMKMTGQFPARDIRDFSWKWTIFITLGFAFISSIVYLLGIKKSGSFETTGIPAFFFNTEISYFSILTLYVIVAILIVQSNKISGYQSIGLIIGFWCAHWLIYDWIWWAIDIGMGETSIVGFWEKIFGSPILIPHIPMWMFLLISILGGIMAFYTLSIPNTYSELLPPTLWLYTVYPNASICMFIGLNEYIILVIGIILIIISFAGASFFIINRLKQGFPNWLKNKKGLRESVKKKNWKLDPLSIPWIFTIIFPLLSMPFFLLVMPVVGLFFGFISWLLIPLTYLLYKGSSILRFKKVFQVGLALFLVTFLVLVMFFMHQYAM